MLGIHGVGSQMPGVQGRVELRLVTEHRVACGAGGCEGVIRRGGLKWMVKTGFHDPGRCSGFMKRKRGTYNIT